MDENDISDKIKKKINEIVKDENEKKLILELLVKTKRYDAQTKSLTIKKEFQLLLDQYFPFNEGKNE